MRADVTETMVVHINFVRTSKSVSAPFTGACYWPLELVFWNISLEIVTEFSEQNL